MLYHHVPLHHRRCAHCWCVLMLTCWPDTGEPQRHVLHPPAERDLGAVNGYIEEMIEGQKVVKVFCHEEQAKDGV